MEFSLEFKGWPEWQQQMRLIGARAKDFNKVMVAGLNIFGFRDIAQHFRDEKGPDGMWPERSEWTQMEYLRRNKTNSVYDPGNKLLQLTGRLRQSLIRGGNSGARGIGKNVVAISSNVEYSGKHDEGEGRIPQRKFMWLSDGAIESMNKLILDFLTDGKIGGA